MIGMSGENHCFYKKIKAVTPVYEKPASLLGERRRLSHMAPTAHL